VRNKRQRGALTPCSSKRAIARHSASSSRGLPSTRSTPSMLGIALGLVGLGIWAWITIKYVSANGQSIAKRMLNIKVVRSDGSKASLGRIFWLRNVVNALLAVIPFYGIIDALFIFGETRQCLHDKLADTIVVKA
jgi:uncharacterized RDD family membrane protein YckC